MPDVLRRFTRTRNATLVPIDPTHGVACPSSTVTVQTMPYISQMIRAIHFAGDTGGVVLETYASGGVRRLLFTRVRRVP